MSVQTEQDAAQALFDTLAGPGGHSAPWEFIGDLSPELGEYVKSGLTLLTGNPALDLRTRELAVISILAALGGQEPQLTFHVGGALHAGATPAEVIETIAQVGVYAGVPRALNALAVARGVLKAFAEADGAR